MRRRRRRRRKKSPLPSKRPVNSREKPKSSKRIPDAVSRTSLYLIIVVAFLSILAGIYFFAPRPPPGSIPHLVKQISSTILSHGIRSHPNTPGLHRTRNFISSYLRSNGLFVDHDMFNSSTPLGVVEFENIIAMTDGRPNSPLGPEIVFAAHYESKYFTEFEFLGASDSAVPCAMLMALAKHVSERALDKNANGVNFRFLFFDGEESFGKWSAEDSLFGSRHLAEVWTQHDERYNEAVRVFVLLDLIGGVGAGTFHDFVGVLPPGSSQWFERMKQIEWRIFGSSLSPLFKGRQSRFVDDDHMPFIRSGFTFPVVHLIPLPFPSTWHKVTDDLDHIDWGVVEKVMRILKAFVDEEIAQGSRSGRG